MRHSVGFSPTSLRNFGFSNYLFDLRIITIHTSMNNILESLLRKQGISRAVSWLRFKRMFSFSFFAWLVVFIFVFAYSKISLLNEVHLNNGLDLGIFHQTLFNISRGKIPFSSLKNQVIWGDHANFIMYLLIPVYKVFPDVRTLLISQVVIVATSCWALFRIALDKLKSPILSFVILTSSLVFFGLQYALDFDFHASVIGAAFLSWLLYALHFKKKIFWFLLLLALISQEDVAPIVFMIGFYLFVAKRKKTAVAVMLISLVYFFTIGYYVMPRWTPNHKPLTHFDYSEYGEGAGKNIFGIAAHPLRTAQQMTDQKVKVRTLTAVFASTGYISLLSPFTYLTALPPLLSRFLSVQDLRWQINYHYNVTLLPLVMFGTILGLSRILNFRLVAKNLVLRAFIILATSLVIGQGTYKYSWKDKDLPLHKLFWPGFVEEKYIPSAAVPAVKIIKTMIPSNKKVTAASGLVPMLSDRQYIYNFPDQDKQTQWVILSDQFNTWPLRKGEMKQAIKEYRSNTEYEIVWDEFGVWAFRKKGN